METNDRGGSLEVIYDELELSVGHKGMGSAVGRMLRKVGELDTEQLCVNLAALHRRIDTILTSVGDAASKYQLNSFEIVADFTAKGEIRLVGAASGEFRGGIKLTFVKKASATST